MPTVIQTTRPHHVCLLIVRTKAMARRCVQAILAYSLHNLFQCATVDAALLQVKRG